MELVIPGHLFDDRAVCILFKNNEMPDNIEEPALVAHTFDQDFKFRHSGRGEIVAADCSPAHEPFTAR